jgi:ABC-type phosphate/phosphonate transport system substrate-binding protein
MPQEKKDLVKVIDASKDMPNQTVTVSTKVSVYNREKIKEFLTSIEGAKSADKLLSTYSRANKKFLPANDTEYTSLENLIEGVVYGW